MIISSPRENQMRIIQKVQLWSVYFVQSIDANLHNCRPIQLGSLGAIIGLWAVIVVASLLFWDHLELLIQTILEPRLSPENSECLVDDITALRL